MGGGGGGGHLNMFNIFDTWYVANKRKTTINITAAQCIIFPA